MKKLRFLLLFVLAAALLAPAALADVIVEPQDLFIQTHDCEHLPRSYTANGEKGYVSLHDSPLSAVQKENVLNGEEFYIEYRYTDGAGELWGAVSDGESAIRGWVKLSDCLVTPDYISFLDAHGEEFTSFDPAYRSALEGLDNLVLWKYPGSGTVVCTMDSFPDDLENYLSSCYTAPDGSCWGFIGYIYGIRNTWVCISDPANPDLKPIEGILPAAGEAVPPAENLPLPSSLWLAIGLVAAVAAVTAAVIGVVFRRKKRV